MRPVVLYVDDERNNRLLVRQSLGDEFEVLLAKDGFEALRVLEQNKVNVLLADHRMPGMTGVELFARAKELFPGLPRILVSAYPEEEGLAEAVQQGTIQKLLAKPWTLEVLTRALWQALGDARSQ